MENKVNLCFGVLLFMNCAIFLRAHDEISQHKEMTMKKLQATGLKIETQFMPAHESPEESFEVVKTTCIVEEKTIHPEKLVNTRNEEVRILNSDNFKQSISIRRCINRNELCNKHLVHPANILSVCRQSYVTLSLKTLNKNDEIINDEFRIPSYCSCQLVTRKKSGLIPHKTFNLIDDNKVE